jgi:two-component system, NtrC family, response regulator AtoC
LSERILIVEDEENLRFVVAETLKRSGYEVEEAGSAEEGLEKIERQSPDLVIMDIRLPGISGLEAMGRVKAIDPNLPILVVTAFGSKEVALEAVKKGAYDFFTKPFKLDEIEVVVNRALEKRRLQRELQELQARLAEKYRIDNIIGYSGKMQDVLKLVQKVAPTEALVLIGGESGTGKELVAEAIHSNSRRKDKPFIKLNCAAIPEGLIESELFGHERGSFTGAVSRKIGKFEIAEKGTIFLDEIGDMPMSAQAKVLRVLQNRTLERVGGNTTIQVDVRILAATNKDLLKEVKERRFREDLYFRLTSFPIVLPPLRERPEDISFLAEYFVRKSAERMGVGVRGISSEAMGYLKKYNWPGNVRELENVIDRAVIMAEGELVTPASLSSHIVATQSVPRPDLSQLDETISRIEKDMIIDGLQKAGWVQSKAAKLLGITERSLWHRLKKYRIDIKKLQNL